MLRLSDAKRSSLSRLLQRLHNPHGVGHSTAFFITPMLLATQPSNQNADNEMEKTPVRTSDFVSGNEGLFSETMFRGKTWNCSAKPRPSRVEL